MNLSRAKPLDWILISAYVGFAVVEVYRYRTQGSVPVTDLVVAAMSSLLYWKSGYRSPRGSRNPTIPEWVFGTSLGVLGACVGFGVIWSFAFSDSAAERWHRAAISAAAITVSAAICAWTVTKFKPANKAPDRTAPTVTPSAAQEPRH